MFSQSVCRLNLFPELTRQKETVCSQLMENYFLWDSLCLFTEEYIVYGLSVDEAVFIMGHSFVSV